MLFPPTGILQLAISAPKNMYKTRIQPNRYTCGYGYENHIWFRFSSSWSNIIYFNTCYLIIWLVTMASTLKLILLSYKTNWNIYLLIWQDVQSCRRLPISEYSFFNKDVQIWHEVSIRVKYLMMIGCLQNGNFPTFSHVCDLLFYMDIIFSILKFLVQIM